MLIGVDIDEPIYPFSKQFALWCSIKTQRPLTEFDAPKQWEFAEQWGLTKEEWVAHFESFVLEYEGFRRLAVEVSTLDAIGRLRERHDLIFVTARGTSSYGTEQFRRESRLQTIDFLSQCGWGDLPIAFTADKSLIGCDVLIDDSLSNLRKFAASANPAARAICWDAANNREWVGLRARSWREVEQLIATRMINFQERNGEQ